MKSIYRCSLGQRMLTCRARPSASNVYPDFMAATNGNDGEVVYMNERPKFDSAHLTVLLPSTIAIKKRSAL